MDGPFRQTLRIIMLFSHPIGEILGGGSRYDYKSSSNKDDSCSLGLDFIVPSNRYHFFLNYYLIYIELYKLYIKNYYCHFVSAIFSTVSVA